MKKIILVTLILLMTNMLANRFIFSSSVAEVYQESYSAESNGDYDSAIKWMKKLLKNNADYFCYLRLGWLYYAEGKYKYSTAYYSKAVKINSYSIQARSGLMLSYMANLDWDNAKTIGMHILKIDPRNYYALSRLAYVNYNIGKYSIAIKYYNEVLKYYPDDLDMLSGLGWSYSKMGNKKKAKSLFEKVLTYNSAHVSAGQGYEEVK